MKYLHIVIFVSVVFTIAVFWTGDNGALAQFGLYGSPEILQLPPGQSAFPRYREPAASATPIPVAYQRRPEANGPNILTQMMDESGQCSPTSYLMPERKQKRGCSEFDRAVREPCNADCAACTPSCCCPWYALGTGLIMGRDKANHVWTSYESGNDVHQMTHTGDIELQWRGGGEIRIGRRFCGCGWGLEATYWTLDPFIGYVSTMHANGVSTPLRVSEIEFAGVNGVLLFDNAEEHRLWRRDELHNFEINLVHGYFNNQDYSPWDVSWSLGVRYFRFEENLRFGSLAGGGTWGGNGGADEAYLDDNIKNNLFGFQLGCEARSNRWRNVNLFIAPSIGIYNNYIENRFQAYRGDGVVANPTAASGMTGSYPVESDKSVLSFLTQIDLGVNWQLTQRWSARIGYRVLAVTGMGLADHQIPHYIVDTPEIADIDTNGTLILHGGFAGVTYNY